MIRFATCTYFALVGSGLVTPITLPDLATRIRLAVAVTPGSEARIVAIKAYRGMTGSTLEGARTWVEAHPEAWKD
jgi:ribosomal protein L7/L12